MYGWCARYAMERLRSYGAAMREFGIEDRQETGRWLNDRAENSHLPFRRGERAKFRFRRTRTLQKFTVILFLVHNLFKTEGSPFSRQHFDPKRAGALAEWRGFCAGEGTDPSALL